MNATARTVFPAARIPEGASYRRCSACSEPIFFVRDEQTGNVLSVNPDGTNHHAVCPDTIRYRKKFTGATR